MKIFFEKPKPRNDSASENSRFDKQEYESTPPFTNTPEFSIMFQHQAKDSKYIFKYVKSVEE